MMCHGDITTWCVMATSPHDVSWRHHSMMCNGDITTWCVMVTSQHDVSWWHHNMMCNGDITTWAVSWRHHNLLFQSPRYIIYYIFKSKFDYMPLNQRNQNYILCWVCPSSRGRGRCGWWRQYQLFFFSTPGTSLSKTPLLMSTNEIAHVLISSNIFFTSADIVKHFLY